MPVSLRSEPLRDLIDASNDPPPLATAATHFRDQEATSNLRFRLRAGGKRERQHRHETRVGDDAAALGAVLVRSCRLITGVDAGAKLAGLD